LRHVSDGDRIHPVPACMTLTRSLKVNVLDPVRGVAQ
jgi:hypothetical protein